MWRGLLAALVLAAGLAACDGGDEATPPGPVDYSGDVTGYFCGMLLAEHEGPKGQIHLKSRAEPVFFSSVRDTIAFTRLEGEAKDIAAIYVNDMAKATNWQEPEPGTWVDARRAWFVVDSRRVGGMGLPEAVPFGTREAADGFASDNGGLVMQLDEIPTDYVLGVPDMPAAQEGDHATH